MKNKILTEKERARAEAFESLWGIVIDAIVFFVVAIAGGIVTLQLIEAMYYNSIPEHWWIVPSICFLLGAFTQGRIKIGK